MMKRLDDWQLRLEACLAERWALAFAWGLHDCGLHAAAGVLAVTGVDVAADVRGTYADAKGAAKVLQRVGGLAGLAASRLGPEVMPLQAQPGDIGLVEHDGRECLAICVGDTWSAPGEHGLVNVPIEAGKRAWRVERES